MEIKYVSADDAVKLIHSGHRLYLQGSTSTPMTLLEALARRGHELSEVTVYAGFAVTDRPLPLCRPEFKDTFLINTYFVNNSVRKWIADGYGVTTPKFFSQVPAMLRERVWDIDVVLLNCSMPNKDGFVTFAVSGDATIAAVECARIIIAQINPRMPFSYGDAKVHVSRLDAAVLVDEPLSEVATSVPTADEEKIGRYIAEHIPDGATLQVGVGGIPNAVLHALQDHKNLGLHTEAITDGMVPLLESGVIDNSRKRLLKGKSVAALCIGGKRLYNFMDYNPDLVFRDVSWVNDPFVISQNPRVMAINSCIEVDLTGQICADSIGSKIFSGVGGQQDFVQGAARSEGGASFTAMLSTTPRGVNKIKPLLTHGAGVVTTRFQAHYIVTENGIASMAGCSLPERARRLIALAAPKFREELERAAAERYGYSFMRLKNGPLL